MSNLLNDAEGRNAIREAQLYLLRRALSRFFPRNLVIDYEQWSKGLAEFDLSTLLGALNESWDDEIRDLYRLLGTIGGLTESIADTEIYVDSVTGNDVTGTGSSSRPYASLWFLPWIPKRINHKYRILIIEDLDHGDKITITNDFGDEGCLSFIGVGAEVEVLSGLSGTVSNPPTSHQNVWHEFTGSVLPTTATLKTFIQYTSGVDQNHAVPVNRIDAVNGYIWTRYHPSANIVQNDTYRYVVPPVELTVEGLDIDCNGSEYVGLEATYRGARVVFCNLTINLDDGSLTVKRLVTTKGVPVSFGFCQIYTNGQADGTERWPISFQNNINEYCPVDTQVETLSQSNVQNIFALDRPTTAGLQFTNKAADEFVFSDQVLELVEDANLYYTDCMASCRVYLSNTEIYKSSFKQLRILSSNAHLHFTMQDPNNVGNDAMHCFDSTLYSTSILFGRCLDAAWTINSRWRFDGGGGDAGVGSFLTQIVGYSFGMNGMSKIYTETAWSGTSGTTNDIAMYDTAAPTPFAFPAVNSQVNDGLFNVVMRGN